MSEAEMAIWLAFRQSSKDGTVDTLGDGWKRLVFVITGVS